MEDVAKALFGTILENYGIVGLLSLLLFCAILYGLYCMLKKVFDTQDRMIESQKEAWSKGFEGMTKASENQVDALNRIDRTLSSLETLAKMTSKEQDSISEDIKEQKQIMDKITEELRSLEEHLRNLEINIKDKQTGVLSYEEIQAVKDLLEKAINDIRECNDKVADKIMRKLRHLEEIMNQKDISVGDINAKIEEIRDAVAQYGSRLTA